MELERSAPLPIRGELRRIVMGADSAGPILAYWMQPQGKQAFDPTWLSLFDLGSLKGLRPRKRSPPRTADQCGQV